MSDERSGEEKPDIAAPLAGLDGEDVRVTPTLDEVVANHRGPTGPPDAATLAEVWQLEPGEDGLEVYRDLMEMRRADRDRHPGAKRAASVLETLWDNETDAIYDDL